MEYHVIAKEKMPDFVATLARQRKVYAPVSKGNGCYAFEEVSDAKEIAFDYVPTMLPPKKYFMPQREDVLSFNGRESAAVLGAEQAIIFGVHTCDIAGIQCLDLVMADDPQDENYLARKNKLLIVGLECGKYCDDNASCALMNTAFPSGGYDLMLTDMGVYYLVHAHTQAGSALVEAAGKLLRHADSKHLAELDKYREEKRRKFKPEIPVEAAKLPEIFKKSVASPVWKNLGERCLSCGNCTNVCPTCYCFDMADSINLDMKSGVRTRIWDSCQTKPFAQVTGGENFRPERSERQRHRYYRKFSYPLDKYYRFFCTGCGRCTRACMAEINMKQALGELAGGVK
ncbi:MAG TPA: 4Fe-4S dicluster domain-containing protein [Elusimicrobiales bacterium]|nr:4Fe-4S dicluster domain-containing protein [Elusimicrobiales bacterium]